MTHIVVTLSLPEAKRYARGQPTQIDEADLGELQAGLVATLTVPDYVAQVLENVARQPQVRWQVRWLRTEPESVIDARLHRRLEQLNALWGAQDAWRLARARKEHEDEFGDTILPGDEFCFYQTDALGFAGLRLSVRSMRALLRIILDQHGQWETVAEVFRDILDQRQQETIANLGRSQ